MPLLSRSNFNPNFKRTITQEKDRWR
ncbi:hypothetical protein ACVNP1_04165 [Staphylococcus aureus]